MSDIPARDRLMVALDMPRVEDARDLVARLGDAASFYKIGLELVMSGGLDLDARAGARRQAGVPRHEAARHRQHRRARHARRRRHRRHVPHRARPRQQDHPARRQGRSRHASRSWPSPCSPTSTPTILPSRASLASPEELVVRRAQAQPPAATASSPRARRPPACAAVGPGTLIVTPGIRLPTDDAATGPRRHPSPPSPPAPITFVVGRPPRMIAARRAADTSSVLEMKLPGSSDREGAGPISLRSA